MLSDVRPPMRLPKLSYRRLACTALACEISDPREGERERPNLIEREKILAILSNCRRPPKMWVHRDTVAATKQGVG